MTPALDNKLCEKYPKLFADRHKSPQETCMCWGFECGDGWYWLIDSLCSALQSRIDNTTPKPPQVVVDQVKEKYGRLCFYHHGGDEVSSGMVELAEHQSNLICEACGQTDSGLVGQTTKGWIKVCCKDCISELLNFEPETYGWEPYEKPCTTQS
jgi:hypothetical protein